MEGLAAAASVITVVEIAAEITKLCGGYIRDVRHASQHIQRLLSKVSALSDVLIRLQNTPQMKDQEVAMAQCVTDLRSIKEKLEPSKRRKAMTRVGMRALKWPFTSKEVEEKVRILESYLRIFNLSLQLDIGGKVTSAEEERLLKELAYVSDARFDSQQNQRHRPCLENTRVELLNEIMQWAASTSPQCIFWLKGMAGYGKSTLAISVATKLKQISQCQASFFFRRGFGDLAHARKLIPTLVQQLARASSVYRGLVLETIRREPDLGQIVNFRDQYEKLIMEPLRKLRSSTANTSRFFVIIDALDECDEESDLRFLLRLFATTKDLSSLQIRIFVTSRPEWVILQSFQNMPSILYRDFVLNNVPRTVVDSDIKTFLRHELQFVQQDRGLALPWPQEPQISTLVSKATGLFIFAATACRYVAASPLADPQERLEQICNAVGQNRLMTQELDQMYTIILQNSTKGSYTEEERRRIGSHFRRVVGSIVVLLNPLPMLELYKLLHDDQLSDQRYFKDTLRSLSAVIDVPQDAFQSVQPLHLSFRDFLLNHDRCLEAQFQVNEQKTHRKLAADCVRLLLTSLQRNMCNLPSAGTLCSEITQNEIDAALSPAVKYACRYWAAHLQQAKVDLIDNGSIHEFLRTHFLHWLEAMSLMGKTSEAIVTLTKIAAMVNSLRSPVLYDLIHDYRRFLLAFRQAIASAPGQLYESALFFSPLQSTIRKTFSDAIPTDLRFSPPVRERWSASLQTLEGHYGRVNMVVFSPNGELVASASQDHTVRLWETQTGDSHAVLKGHSGWIYTVVFSPDGQLLVSGSGDGTVRLWDVQTGDSRAVLDGHSNWVSTAVFSPDGQLVASASGDQTVRLWEAQTANSRAVLEGHSDSVSTVVFSPDGQLVASASGDQTVRLWEAQTGDSHAVLKGHSGWISTVVFSPDGQLLVSGSGDGTVRLWDVQTGDSRAVLEGHSDLVSTAVFSPDGQLVASASRDHALRLWNVLTGDFLTVLKGHSGMVSSVVFSPNGQLLASGSHDGTVRLWDAQTGDSHAVLKGHSSAIYTIVFSPDGQLVASGSYDTTVRLWEVQAEDSRAIAKGHSDMVCAIEFSPDGELVASGSYDYTVRLWEAQTGDSRAVLKGHSKPVSTVVFSPDGQLVASGSLDGTVRLWDVLTDNSCNVLRGHSETILDVVFSPDGQLVASSSDDYTIRLWDVLTYACRAIFKGHYGRIYHLLFSPDSQLMVSGSRDSTVRLWDMLTGECRAVLEGHSDLVSTIVFSPDGQLVASSSDDGIIRLWEARTGACRAVLKGHSEQVSTVVFSPDGQLVASGSRDCTVRLWDMRDFNQKFSIPLLSPPFHLEFDLDVDSLVVDSRVFSISSQGLAALRTARRHNTTAPTAATLVFDGWLMMSSFRFLWLPPEYRSLSQASHGNTMVLGFYDGRVIFLWWDISSVL